MATQTEKEYYRIPMMDINPFVDRELEKTIYLLGSPGSGKTRFMKRLKDEA
jgi:Cdc6-like AAA superfamily ATPase